MHSLSLGGRESCIGYKNSNVEEKLEIPNKEEFVVQSRLEEITMVYSMYCCTMLNYPLGVNNILSTACI